LDVRIAGLGENARGLSIGEEVYGLIAFDRNGAAADYATAPAADLADRPRSVSHAQAASLPLAALTAWQALGIFARSCDDRNREVSLSARDRGSFRNSHRPSSEGTFRAHAPG
jgi:hypothetical protein